MSRGRRVLVVALALSACLAVFAALRVASRSPRRFAWSVSGRSEAAMDLYHCPMHPSMTSDGPSDCPICGMRMVRGDGRDAAMTGRKIIYRSTMNPSETSDYPGRDSMGMEMEPVQVDMAGTAESRVDGRAAVAIAPTKQQLIGVRTEAAARVPFVRSIRTVGQVTLDETRLHHVHTKVGGWVETLQVNATGVAVRRGEPLLSVYSPELVATQEEYLVALRARRAASGATLPGVSGRADDLLESTRRRLLLFDLRPAQIDELERTGNASLTVSLYAPIAGYVTERNVTQGEKIDPSMTLLDIADLSRVWVIASIYEYELPFVRVGETAEVTFTYLPGRSYSGRVGLVYPTLDAATRTAKVRLEFDNPRLELKPEMFADVRLQADLGPRLSIPDTAVIATGTRDVVFVARGEGVFEPREVRLGLRLPDRVEVLDGLSEGEAVVTSGNFLVDSESKLKAALQESVAPEPAK